MHARLAPVSSIFPRESPITQVTNALMRHIYTVPPSCQVGPGVKALCEGDVVLPGRPFLGTWATATLAQEKDLMRLPPVREHA